MGQQFKVVKNLESKENVLPKILGQKKYGSKIIFGPKIFLVQEKFVQKYFGSKHFWVNKFLVQKTLGPKNLGIQKIFFYLCPT